MITFDSRKYRKTKDGTYYLSWDHIEAMTEEILEDYKPKLLTDPQPIEYSDLLEYYFNASLEYQPLCDDKDGSLLLGCTVFEAGCVSVLNDHGNPEHKYFAGNTVILNPVAVDGERKAQENFTALHEAGHYFMHRELFLKHTEQGLFDFAIGCVRCNRNDISDTNQHKRNWTEWQANAFAIAIAMPLKSLQVSVPDILRRYGIDDGHLIISPETLELARHIIPDKLRTIYNMSKEAIFYRLKDTNFYISEEQAKANSAQLTLGF